MKELLLTIALLLNVNVATPLSTSSIDIEYINYEVTSKSDTPHVNIKFNSIGNVDILIVTSAKGKEVGRNNYSSYISDADKIYEYDFAAFTSKKQTYNLAITVNEKTYNLNVISAAEGSTKLTPSSSNKVVSMFKESKVDATNKQVTVNESIDFRYCFVNEPQNRIFDLSRYRLVLNNVDINDVGGSLVSDCNFEEEFKKGINYSVDLKVINKNGQYVLALNDGYFYDENTSKMNSISGYPIKNVILISNANDTMSSDIVVNILDANNYKITLDLSEISINYKNIYGDCASSLFCVSKEDALEDVKYKKEVIYP